MNRGQLISYLKSIIYPNSENKIDAGKHQDLEEKILQNVLVKDDDIVSGEENSSASTVFSSDYVKTTYATKTELSDKIAAVYRSKGNVANFGALPTSPENGDVYNLLDTGMNYVYAGNTVAESHPYDSANWDSLGGIQGLATALQNGLMSKEDFAKLRDLSSGKSITSIAKTSTIGLVDTYTITYTDDTTDTFTVTNGTPGSNGSSTELAEYVLSGLDQDIKTGMIVSETVREQHTITSESIYAEVTTAPASLDIVFDIKKNGVSIFSTLPKISAGTLVIAGTQILSSTTTTFNVGDIRTIFVNQVGLSESGKNLVTSILMNKIQELT